MINKHNLSSAVIVMDQAIYSKAQEIRWQNHEFKSRLVLRLGEFHTAMSFLAVIGKRFRDAGLEDLMIESGMLAQGSANGAMSGYHDNTAMRCHKLVVKAMQRLRFSQFLDSLPGTEYIEAVDNLSRLHESCFPEDFSNELKNTNVQNLEFQLGNGATREGAWKLHLSTVRDMLPWYFA